MYSLLLKDLASLHFSNHQSIIILRLLRLASNDINHKKTEDLSLPFKCY